MSFVSPLHQRADLATERLVDFRARRFGVFNRVVQKGRNNRGVVELQIGENRGDFERMRKIRIARRALLLAMRHHRVNIGAVEQIFVGVRIVGADAIDQIVLPHHLGARRLLRRHRLTRNGNRRDRVGRGLCLL